MYQTSLSLKRFSFQALPALVFAALAIAPVANAAVIYDAAGDFSSSSNPNGVWSYGQSTTLGGSFSTMAAGGCGTLSGWSAFGSGAPGQPAFVLSGIGNCGGGMLSSATLLNMHPGDNGQNAIVRWTSPASGNYTLTGLFIGLDPVPTTTDVHVLLNGVSQFDGVVNTFGGTPVSFSLGGALAAGDTLDFAVGYGPNGHFFSDSTGFNATINFSAVPEPSSIYLLLAGGSFLAVKLVRRKSRVGLR